MPEVLIPYVAVESGMPPYSPCPYCLVRLQDIQVPVAVSIAFAVLLVSVDGFLHLHKIITHSRVVQRAIQMVCSVCGP